LFLATFALKTAERCAKYIQARAQPEVSGACKQALGNPATWWRNTQPLPSRKKTVIFCVALTAQIFTQDIHANQYLMSLELGKLDYCWFQIKVWYTEVEWLKQGTRKLNG